MKRSIAILACVCAGLLMAGCHKSGSGEASASNDGRPETAPATQVSPESVRLTDAQVKNIRIEPVSLQTVPVHLTVNGKISFNEDETTPVLSPVAGQVQGLKLKVGDRVSKGQVLMSVRSRDVAAAIDDYLESRKDLDLSEKTYQMTKELFDKQAASKLALQQAENDLAKAKAKVARLRQQLRILDVNGDGTLDTGELNPLIAIKAPRDGTIVDRKVSEGQLVQGDSTALLTIADLSSVWVLADVFERDLPLVRVDEPAAVTTLAYPDERFMATVSRISDVVDPVTRTVKVRLLVPNPEHRLKPEMFATVTLLLDEKHNAITVPAKAVFTENGNSYVFVRSGDSEFRMCPVNVASADGGRMRIVQGLTANEHVVSEGALLLRGALRAAAEGENAED